MERERSSESAPGKLGLVARAVCPPTRLAFFGARERAKGQICVERTCCAVGAAWYWRSLNTSTSV
eukprot:1815794-Prymnesium_polylepis.2